MQGKWYSLAILGALSVFFLSKSAFAVMSLPDGWYLEANVGSTHISNLNFPGKKSSSGIGGNANLGYKFMPYFAMEIEYSRYANTTIKNSSGTKTATDKIYSYGIVGKGILPLQATGFELFAKLGVQRMNGHVTVNNVIAASSLGISNSQHSATGLYIGAGGQYYFMPELAVVAQWQRAQGNNHTGNADLFTGGISFLFN